MDFKTLLRDEMWSGIRITLIRSTNVSTSSEKYLQLRKAKKYDFLAKENSLLSKNFGVKPNIVREKWNVGEMRCVRG